MKRILVYPVFLKCIEFTTDIYWASIFENMAYGRFPDGVYMVNDSIFCKIKNKKLHYKIESNLESSEIYSTLYTFFSEKLKLNSNKESISKKIEFDLYKIDFNTLYPTWHSIRKKNIQDNLIENFVIDMRKKYTLSLRQTRNLSTLISIGRMLKVIKTVDFQYTNGKIINIDGLTFTNKKVIMDRDIYEGNEVLSTFVDQSGSVAKINVTFLSTLWYDFLNALKDLQS